MCFVPVPEQPAPVLLAPAYLPRSIPRLVRRAICPMDFSSASGKSNLACALSSRQEVYSFSFYQGASSKGAPFLIRQQVLVAVVSTTPAVAGDAPFLVHQQVLVRARSTDEAEY